MEIFEPKKRVAIYVQDYLAFAPPPSAADTCFSDRSVPNLNRRDLERRILRGDSCIGFGRIPELPLGTPPPSSVNFSPCSQGLPFEFENLGVSTR